MNLAFLIGFVFALIRYGIALVPPLALRVNAKKVAAVAKVADAETKIGQLRTAIAAKSAADEAEANLNALYAKQRALCDEKALVIYERLVKANHPRPLMKVDPNTRATPLGNCISTNALEMLRLGQLVVDQTSNAILYIDEPAEAVAPKVERQEQLPTSSEAAAPVAMPETAPAPQ